MIGLDIPLAIIRGKCPRCRERISQALIPGEPRCWLRVNNVYGAGDDDEALAGFVEHQCIREDVAA